MDCVLWSVKKKILENSKKNDRKHSTSDEPGTVFYSWWQVGEVTYPRPRTSKWCSQRLPLGWLAPEAVPLALHP